MQSELSLNDPSIQNLSRYSCTLFARTPFAHWQRHRQFLKKKATMDLDLNFQ